MPLTINPVKYDLFVGIDVDQKSYAITYLDQNFQGRSLKMPADPRGLLQYFQKNFPQLRLVFAYEAGPTGYALYDYLVSQEQHCLVIHPASLKKAPNDRVKTNRLDSQRIVEQLKAGHLKGIRIPTVPFRQLRHLVHLRQTYAQQIMRTKQRIKALLLLEDIHIPDGEGRQLWSARGLQTLRGFPMQETLRFKMDFLLNDLDYVRERLLLVLRQLRSFCQKEPSIHSNLEHLRSLPGFGLIISTYTLARIGDPARLRNVRELGSFCGIVPREYSTGDQIQRGRITHFGDPTLRRLLVEASWIAIRKDTELQQFYNRLRSKNRRPEGVRVAIVAVARKLTHRVYRVLKEQRPYVIH